MFGIRDPGFAISRISYLVSPIPHPHPYFTFSFSVASVAALGRGLEHVQHLIQTEGARLLARREFLERGDELPDELLCRPHKPQLGAKPAKIHLRLAGEALER